MGSNMSHNLGIPLMVEHSLVSGIFVFNFKQILYTFHSTVTHMYIFIRMILLINMLYVTINFELQNHE